MGEELTLRAAFIRHIRNEAVELPKTAQLEDVAWALAHCVGSSEATEKQWVTWLNDLFPPESDAWERVSRSASSFPVYLPIGKVHTFRPGSAQKTLQQEVQERRKREAAAAQCTARPTSVEVLELRLEAVVRCTASLKSQGGNTQFIDWIAKDSGRDENKPQVHDADAAAVNAAVNRVMTKAGVEPYTIYKKARLLELLLPALVGESFSEADIKAAFAGLDKPKASFGWEGGNGKYRPIDVVPYILSQGPQTLGPRTRPSVHILKEAKS